MDVLLPLLWYAGVIFALGLMLLAFHYRRTMARYGSDEVSAFTRLLGTDFGVTACGILVLAVILGWQLSTPPAGRRAAKVRFDGERQAYQALGETLGKDLHEKAKNLPGSKALIIAASGGGKRAAAYAQAMIAGLKLGFGSRIEIVKEELLQPDVSPDTTDTRETATETLVLSSRRFNALVAANSECNVVVCLVDVAPDIGDTPFATRAGSGTALLGVFSRNPYQLGAAIDGRITACAVPRREFRWRPPTTPSTPAALFQERFILVTPNTIVNVAKDNRQLFYLTARLDDRVALPDPPPAKPTP